MWLMAWRSRTIAAILALISTLAASLAQIPARLKRTIQFFGLRRPVSVWNEESAPVWSGETLRVLCWNVQYCAGIRQHFFYDGGMAVSTPRAEVFKTATDIGNAIAEANPDVVLLQEVDRGSRRTAFIDEFELLASILYERGLTCRCSASYWRVPYVPHPKHEHVGRVSMHLVTFSRFRISSAVRWQLPLLKESRLRRIFNLRRAALEVDLQVSPGNKPLSLINTHLSAFSYGDGTLTRQVTFILDKILHPKQQHSWLLAGVSSIGPPVVLNYGRRILIVSRRTRMPKNWLRKPTFILRILPT